jgi:hypothetical protein
MKTKNVGERICVKADPILGTPAAMGTIVEVLDNSYLVHIDGDDPEWFGPVSLNGEILCP